MIEVSKKDRRKYEAILKEELLTALGCTEPIAIAYAAAKAKETLGTIPDSIIVECSGNLIKNARAVVVPMTEDLRGIEAAAVLGAVGGNPAKELEVLTDVTGEDLTLTKQLLAQEICEVKLLDTPAKLNIRVRCKKGADSSLVEILHEHNHIVHIERNGEVLYDIPHSLEDVSESGTDRSCLSLEKIVSYGATADLSGLYEVLDKQIAYNSAIAQEGLSRPWGESVGRTLLEVYGNSVNVRARAAAAAGSDARMNGCEMPVVINSGSGNQGITVSVAVIEYARSLQSTHEQLCRALVVSNLVAIMQKYKVGRLSAFCGVVSAGAAAACGIAFLQGADADVLGMIITNTQGNVGGIVCDGAKSSCAAKISSSIEAGLMGYEMAKRGCVFRPGEGLVKEQYEKTIDSFCRMAKDGMEATDRKILEIMIEGC